MKKKIFTAFFILLIVFSVLYYELISSIKYSEGEYAGSGRGYLSEIKVKVTTGKKIIKDIEIISEDENPEIAKIVYPLLIEKIKSSNDSDIDIITGATLTSEGFIEAVNDALRQAEREAK